MKTPNPLLLLSSLGLMLLPACGGGGGSTATSLSAPNSVGFTVEDAAIDNLSTAIVTLSSLKLIAPNGDATANLLSAPRTFEFLGLSTKQALLAMVPSIPSGTYQQVEIMASAASARDLAGVSVPVTLRTVTSRADLSDFGGSVMVFDASAFVPCRIDIDLNRSFLDDLANPGQLVFDLNFLATTDLAPSFDEFRVRVASVTQGSNSFLARIIDDANPGQTFGLMKVQVANGDFMVHDDGRTFNSAAGFMGEMTPGDTLQISGAMTAQGTFNASRVIAEAHSGDNGGGVNDRIEIEGEVLSLNTGAGTFELSLRQVEKGNSTVNPVLASLGDPGSITISFDANTRIVSNDSSSSGTNLVATTLVPGMEIDVRFATFAAPSPFAATSIEVGNGQQSGSEAGVAYEGTIASISGLPNSFSMLLDNSEPAVMDGLVSAAVDATLAAGPSIFLDSGPSPSLLPSQLIDGLRCEVHGALSGAPASATLVASRVKLKPGELDATLISVDLGASTITVSVQAVKRTFGGATPPSGNVVVHVNASAYIRGDGTALDLPGLAAQLAGLGVGQVLVLEVEGTSDGSGGIESWDISAETGNNS